MLARYSLLFCDDRNGESHGALSAYGVLAESVDGHWLAALRLRDRPVICNALHVRSLHLSKHQITGAHYAPIHLRTRLAQDGSQYPRSKRSSCAAISCQRHALVQGPPGRVEARGGGH